MEKQDLATARRQLRSRNIKSRKRALKVLHDARRQATKAKA
ncbi:putative metal homeostasis protein [Lactiplantibacillus daowaiensis]|uniref:Metal homeostasis protein n=1 Tax=Lactiplantibacillus daowaiensis TaxID=2559918 RepID=A0ABW1RYP8_9LACO|nr:putative metal homeostasis protein [Lactiplantibacillus daowaiensis]